VRGKAMIYVYTRRIPKDAPRIEDWKAWEIKFAQMTSEQKAKVLGKSARITLVASGDYLG